MWWNERFASWMCSHQICSNCMMPSCQYGPKSMRNVSNTLLNLCHEEIRQFWRQKGVQPGTRKVYLIKWPVSVSVHVYVYVYIYIRAVKRLIASKIKTFVSVIYVFLLYVCMLCIYKYTHMHVYISEKLYVYILDIFMYNQGRTYPLGKGRRFALGPQKPRAP